MSDDNEGQSAPAGGAVRRRISLKWDRSCCDSFGRTGGQQRRHGQLHSSTDSKTIRKVADEEELITKSSTSSALAGRQQCGRQPTTATTTAASTTTGENVGGLPEGGMVVPSIALVRYASTEDILQRFSQRPQQTSSAREGSLSSGRNVSTTAEVVRKDPPLAADNESQSSINEEIEFLRRVNIELQQKLESVEESMQAHVAELRKKIHQLEKQESHFRQGNYREDLEMLLMELRNKVTALELEMQKEESVKRKVGEISSSSPPPLSLDSSLENSEKKKLNFSGKLDHDRDPERRFDLTNGERVQSNTYTGKQLNGVSMQSKEAPRAIPLPPTPLQAIVPLKSSFHLKRTSRPPLGGAKATLERKLPVQAVGRVQTAKVDKPAGQTKAAENGNSHKKSLTSSRSNGQCSICQGKCVLDTPSPRQQLLLPSSERHDTRHVGWSGDVNGSISSTEWTATKEAELKERIDRLLERNVHLMPPKARQSEPVATHMCLAASNRRYSTSSMEDSDAKCHDWENHTHKTRRSSVLLDDDQVKSPAATRRIAEQIIAKYTMNNSCRRNL